MCTQVMNTLVKVMGILTRKIVAKVIFQKIGVLKVYSLQLIILFLLSLLTFIKAAILPNKIHLVRKKILGNNPLQKYKLSLCKIQKIIGSNLNKLQRSNKKRARNKSRKLIFNHQKRHSQMNIRINKNSSNKIKVRFQNNLKVHHKEIHINSKTKIHKIHKARDLLILKLFSVNGLNNMESANTTDALMPTVRKS